MSKAPQDSQHRDLSYSGSEESRRWDLSYTQNRELSWLKFNARVLEEATDPTVPLMERLRFISIFTSNLDEFFMVRVGSLFDLDAMLPDEVDNKSGKTPRQQLDLIFEAVRPLIRFRDNVYAEVSRALAAKGVEAVPVDKLEGADKQFVQDWYKQRIHPLLSPQIIDRSHPFPHLKNKALYCAALLSGKGKPLLGIVEVPETVPVILPLPGAFGLFIMRQAMLGVPKELIEAARIDGCGNFRIFYQIMLPLVKSSIIMLVIFTFMATWNSFLWPLVVGTKESMRTFTVGLSTMQTQYDNNVGGMMASATISFLPPFLLYLVLQKRFVEGVAMTGLRR